MVLCSAESKAFNRRERREKPQSTQRKSINTGRTCVVEFSPRSLSRSPRALRLKAFLFCLPVAVEFQNCLGSNSLDIGGCLLAHGWNHRPPVPENSELADLSGSSHRHSASLDDCGQPCRAAVARWNCSRSGGSAAICTDRRLRRRRLEAGRRAGRFL